MNFLRKAVILLVLTGLFLPAGAQLKLPAVFSDYMVLQQNTRVPVWGWAGPEAMVTVVTGWDEADEVTVQADASGRWEARVAVPEAGQESWIRFSSGGEQVTLNQVVSGEVWLCSGQSNMEMPLAGWTNQPISESEKYIAEADYPGLRLFTVKRKTAWEPQQDCEGSWSPATPETAAGFSATAYFFGLRLHQELGIPVGLIHSSWGGTPAEAWTDADFIRNIPEIAGTGPFDPQAFRQQKLDVHAEEQQRWLARMGWDLHGETPAWVAPDYPDEGWDLIQVPAGWTETPVGQLEGIMHLRLTFEVPARWRKRVTVIDLGPVDEMDITWINGTEVGRHMQVSDWATPRSYEIPAGLLRKGKNTLAVMVVNTSGLGGINGQPDQIRIYPKGSQTIWQPLTGQWRYQIRQAFDQLPPMPPCNNCAEPQTPTTLYNGMIAPLVPFRIAGAIWYQGESNRYDGALYERIFPNMIRNWRQVWGQGDFPFYYVQIAPYSYRDDWSTGRLKEAQTRALALENTGMVVTGDAGSLTTIHPPDKKTVGYRLAAWALAKDYDRKEIPVSGPLYRAWKKEGQQIRIFFDYAESGLIAEGGPLTHFEIAGPDQRFRPARAMIEGETIVVSCDTIEDPVAVRFSWGHTDQPNLFNGDGLPASPFRTDQWKIK